MDSLNIIEDTLLAILFILTFILWYIYGRGEKHKNANSIPGKKSDY